MTLGKLLSRIEEAMQSEPARRTLMGNCPECGEKGPHDTNGKRGQDEAFCCRACGLHFDAIEWI
jgi:transposase-like protein